MGLTPICHPPTEIHLSVSLQLLVNSPSHFSGCGYFNPFQDGYLNYQAQNTDFCHRILWLTNQERVYTSVLLSTSEIDSWSSLFKASLKGRHRSMKKKNDVHQMYHKWWPDFWSRTFRRAEPRSLVLSCDVRWHLHSSFQSDFWPKFSTSMKCFCTF